MRVITRAVFDIESGQLLEQHGFDYDGPVCLAKGATGEERDLAASQADFYQNLISQQRQTFAGQNAIQDSLKAAWDPILAKGPGQKGFTPEQETALRTQATEGTANEYQKAAKATREGMAARGGGTVQLPSGTDEAILGEIASAAAADQSSKNLAITNANYSQGYQRFLNASNALTGNAQIYNPVGLAGAANTGGSDAFGSASTIQSQDAAASPWNVVSGAISGGISSFVNPLATGASVGLGGKLPPPPSK